MSPYLPSPPKRLMQRAERSSETLFYIFKYTALQTAFVKILLFAVLHKPTTQHCSWPSSCNMISCYTSFFNICGVVRFVEIKSSIKTNDNFLPW